MKICASCKRPVSSYYKTSPHNLIFCYDCWIRERESRKFGPNPQHGIYNSEILYAKYFESETSEIKYYEEKAKEDRLRQKEEELKKKEIELMAREKEINKTKQNEQETQGSIKTKIKVKAKKEQVEEYIACPKCGRKIRANSVMCPHCYVKVGNYKVEPYDDNKKKRKSCGCIVFIILLLAGGFVLLTNL